MYEQSLVYIVSSRLSYIVRSCFKKKLRNWGGYTLPEILSISLSQRCLLDLHSESNSVCVHLCICLCVFTPLAEEPVGLLP